MNIYDNLETPVDKAVERFSLLLLSSVAQSSLSDLHLLQPHTTLNLRFQAWRRTCFGHKPLFASESDNDTVRHNINEADSRAGGDNVPGLGVSHYSLENSSKSFHNLINRCITKDQPLHTVVWKATNPNLTGTNRESRQAAIKLNEMKRAIQRV